MRRCAVLVVSLLSFTVAAAAQSSGLPRSTAELDAWIRAHFVGKQRVSLPAVVKEARRLGWTRNAGDVHALKQTFRRLAGTTGNSPRMLELAPRQVPLAFGPLAATEVEYNDTPAYANYLGTLTPAGLSVQGTIGNNEADCFGFDVPTEGTVSFAVTASNPGLSYVIMSQRGEWLEWGTTNLPTFDLPAGRYYVGLSHGGSSTSYTLNLGLSIQSLTLLTPSQSNSYSIGTVQKTFKLVVPGEGRVSLLLTSAASADTYLFLYNSAMRYMFDVSDDSRSGSDAGLNAQLPGGIYYVTVIADQATTTKIAYTFTAGSLPVLGCSAQINGNIPGGEEDLDLYRVVIGQPEAETLAIVGNGSNPIPDSYLMVYDRQMGYLVESDEESPTSSLSKLTATLPSGLFYAASSGYYSAGGYTISRACGTAASTKAQAGLNPGNITTISTGSTMVFGLQTPVPIEFNIVEGTLSDAMIGIVDATTGLSVGQNDDAWHYARCNVGSPQAPGEFYVIVKGWDGATGSFDLEVLSPLYRHAGDRIRGLDHAGNVILFLASTSTIPPVNPVPGLTQGFLLLDLLNSVSFSWIVPPAGKLDWVFSLKPSSGIYLQNVSFSVVPLLGTFSNRID